MMIGDTGTRSNRRAAGWERALMGCGGGGGRPGGGDIEMSFPGEPGSAIDMSGLSIEMSGEFLDCAGESGQSRRGVGGLPVCNRF